MILGMRKLFLSFMTAAVLSSGAHTATPDPVANAKAVVTCGNARFTVLTPEMIRIEYSETAQFEDRATFTIVNRNLDIPSYMTTDDGTYLYITTERLSLKYRKGSDPRTVPASPNPPPCHAGQTAWKIYVADSLNVGVHTALPKSHFP